MDVMTEHVTQLPSHNGTRGLETGSFSPIHKVTQRMLASWKTEDSNHNAIVRSTAALPPLGDGASIPLIEDFLRTPPILFNTSVGCVSNSDPSRELLYGQASRL